MPKLLVVVADLHINSTVGLISPGASLDDGGEYRPSKGQRWLWRNWIDFWSQVGKISTTHHAEVWCVMNGDLADKDYKLRGYQNISRNPATIQNMMYQTTRPALEASRRVFVIRGTGSHVGKSANLEEEYARDIAAEKTPEGASSWWAITLECEGVLFDVQHHTSMGRKPWTSPNSLNSLAAELVMRGGRRLPQVAVRSHNHRFGETGLNYPIRVVATPAWQLATEYAARIAAGPADIGGLVFVCDGGNYQMQVIRYQPEAVRPWAELPK